MAEEATAGKKKARSKRSGSAGIPCRFKLFPDPWGVAAAAGNLMLLAARVDKTNFDGNYPNRLAHAARMEPEKRRAECLKTARPRTLCNV